MNQVPNQSQNQSQMQEVDVQHVNALLAALSDQRNTALNTVAQVQADNAVLRQRVEALTRENAELTSELTAAIVAAKTPNEKTKAA